MHTLKSTAYADQSEQRAGTSFDELPTPLAPDHIRLEGAERYLHGLSERQRDEINRALRGSRQRRRRTERALAKHGVRVLYGAALDPAARNG